MSERALLGTPPVSFNEVIKEDTTIEYAMVVKAICEQYGIKPQDLRQITYTYTTWDVKSESKIRHIRQVPHKIYIPESLAPNTRDENETPVLNLTMSPNPTLDDPYDAGIHEYEINANRGKIRMWRWRGFRNYAPLGSYVEFVEHCNLKKFYRFILESQNDIPDALQPVLEPEKLRDIYANSIGFLERGQSMLKTYKEHNIPCKRGLLLAGCPGGGKTYTCKWLRQLCVRKGFDYKVVTFEDYRNALSRGTVSSLFRLAPGEWGIIFFDDMEMALQPKSSGNTHVNTFLTELDGIEPTEGIVYIFTSNQIEDLDTAFVRPGRIDVFMIFQAPNKKLRRVYIENRFHADLLKTLGANIANKDDEIIKDIINRTESYTFAEIEEVRKLMTIDFLDGKEVSVEKTFKLFEKHRQEFADRLKFGFGKMGESADDYDGDCGEDWASEFVLPPPYSPVDLLRRRMT
jgi:hypothetical protein